MITDIFERLFFFSGRGSRNDVKKRLKLVLAHDRSTLNASTLEKMRKEILVVVSKYVELDTDSLERAEELFKKNNIRHIPVVSGDAIIGMLSYTDLLRILVFGFRFPIYFFINSYENDFLSGSLKLSSNFKLKKLSL